MLLIPIMTSNNVTDRDVFMDRIQKLSSYLLAAFNILLVVLPTVEALQWLLIDWGPVQPLIAKGLLLKPVETPEGIVNLETRQWNSLSKSIGFMGGILGVLPLFLSMFILKSIFRNYRKCEIFTLHNARHYKYLGWLFFLDALIAKSLGNMLMVLAVTLSNPPGHRYITLGFGTPNIETLFCGVLVIVISWVMMEASKLHDEQKFTI